MLAYDNLLALTNIHLTLGGYLIEATGARVAVDGYHGESVLGIITEALIGGKQSLINLFFLFCCFGQQLVFFLLGFGSNAIQLAFLYRPVFDAAFVVRLCFFPGLLFCFYLDFVARKSVVWGKSVS